MKKWKVLNESKIKNPHFAQPPPRLRPAGKTSRGEHELRIEDITKALLKNRGIKEKKEIEEFLNPKLENVNIKNVEIDSKNLKKAVARIKLAIKNKERIVVFGDYDVDGICGTAILWETLNSMGAKVMPYIPHRIDEGYGLSTKGIENVQHKYDNVKLIITVDNGIVANKAVDFANKQGIDVIITDHHVPSKSLPKAFSIVHTTKLCGTGVAWILSQNLLSVFSSQTSDKSQSVVGLSVPKNRKPINQNPKTENREPITDSHLELIALATVADLVPLKGANRTLLKFGLETLSKTKRVGLLELFKEAGLENKSIGVYEIGHLIAPRLNAMGRLEYAMDSLRLLCTNNLKRAKELAKVLGSTNRERQDLTLQTVLHAKDYAISQKTKLKSLLFIAHESYKPGIIGLVAGKMVEEFYRPSIVVSIGKKYSKASARSVSGFNIIEFIREHSSYLVDAGGHPMAAGFTVETKKLLELQKTLEDRAELVLNKDLLIRILRIDCELPLSFVDVNLYQSLQKLSPFGMGNPEPTFLSKNAVIEDVRLVGNGGKHLKINFKFQISNFKFGRIDGIAFGMGEMYLKIKIGDKADIVYTIDENEWNGEKRLQLKIKDLVS